MFPRRLILPTLFILMTAGLLAYAAGSGESDPPSEAQHAVSVRSEPGQNPWNRGKPPEDWWAEVERYHGHVGPWNALGWRIGQAALGEFNATWGDHSLDIIIAIPDKTPYSCLMEGLMVGTGNSPGRLNLRMSEVHAPSQIFVSIRSLSDPTRVVVYEPHDTYLEMIRVWPVDQIAQLARECAGLPAEELYRIERHAAPAKDP